MAVDVARVLRDKKFWIASLLVTWAAGLQWHMSWLQKQGAFKQKFGEKAATVGDEGAAGEGN